MKTKWESHQASGFIFQSRFLSWFSGVLIPGSTTNCLWLPVAVRLSKSLIYTWICKLLKYLSKIMRTNLYTFCRRLSRSWRRRQDGGGAPPVAGQPEPESQSQSPGSSGGQVRGAVQYRCTEPVISQVWGRATWPGHQSGHRGGREGGGPWAGGYGHQANQHGPGGDGESWEQH